MYFILFVNFPLFVVHYLFYGIPSTLCTFSDPLFAQKYRINNIINVKNK